MAVQHYIDRGSKTRSGIAHGGIGAGWFEMRADGTTANWNIFNNVPIGWGSKFPYSTHDMLFFKLRVEEEGRNPAVYLLQIEESHNVAGLQNHEYHYLFPWLHGADEVVCEETFPYTRLRFGFDNLPLDICLTTWSPFIPQDAKNSALPVCYFDIEVESTSPRPIKVSMIASVRNAAGYDQASRKYWGKAGKNDSATWVEMGVEGLPEDASSNGTMAIGSLAPDGNTALGWAHPHPYYEELLRNERMNNFDDTAGKGGLEYCFNSVSHFAELDFRNPSAKHTFALAWHFPNNWARDPRQGKVEELSEGAEDPNAGYFKKNEGVYYDNHFKSAAEALQYAVAHHADFEERTRLFHETFYASSLEPFALDAINAQLNTFRAQSWFTKEGNFGIGEGLSPHRAFAGLNTTDVGFYGSIATAALFPELDKNVWQVHGSYQKENGIVPHSITHHFSWIMPREIQGNRIDLPAQFCLQTLRAVRWCNDQAYLKQMWPIIVKAMDYALRERDPDGDSLPDDENQKTTYDNFHVSGLNSYVASIYLAAYKAIVDTAKELGDADVAERYQQAYERGRESFIKRNWNGEYFDLVSTPDGKLTEDTKCCLTDQIAGQWAAFWLGQGWIIDEETAHKAFDAIMRRNYFPEQGLRSCTWPEDTFLHPIHRDTWVDQGNTCWTGVEYGFASLMLYAGREDDALRIIRNVHDRYLKYGMHWDHQEFGGHYYRPMSAWGILTGYLGQSACNGTFSFAPKFQQSAWRCLFTAPQGYGLVEAVRETPKAAVYKTFEPSIPAEKPESLACKLTFRLVAGDWSPESIVVDCGQKLAKAACALDGAEVSVAGSVVTIKLPKGYAMEAGQTLEIAADLLPAS